MSLFPLASPVAGPVEVAFRRRRRTGDTHALPRVALVAMPFAEAVRPSIQVGLLLAILKERGFATRSFHFTLDFAAAVGIDLYQSVAKMERGIEVGEWLFAKAAFEGDAPDDEASFLKHYRAALERDVPAEDAESACAALANVRDVVIPRYLDDLVAEHPWDEFDVVGFTCTFQQNTASFALATRLKRRWPHITTIFGGANFEEPMGSELVRTVPAIDYAVVGEADDALPALLEALACGDDPADLPGVLTRDLTRRVPPRRFDDLARNPPPDYDEYFERMTRLGLVFEDRDVRLPFESARGCWWGEQRHCTFCGLNGATMAFRSKPADVVAREVDRLASRYGRRRFAAVDNILDKRYLDDLIPQFAETAEDRHFFYEVKANLSRRELRNMRVAGVDSLQPGIESLSSHVLHLMRKGTRASQNVNLLRWARYYGIDVAWNILYGFPGEVASDASEQIALVPALFHLQPPDHCGRLRMERFSPLFDDRSSFPATYTRPGATYEYIYPASCNLYDVAYFYDYEFQGSLDDETYRGFGPLYDRWYELWALDPVPSLVFSDSGESLTIRDNRDPGAPKTTELTPVEAAIYRSCSDEAISVRALVARLSEFTEADVHEALASLLSRRLMMQDGALVLALALPARDWALHRKATVDQGGVRTSGPDGHEAHVDLDSDAVQFVREFERPQPLRLPLERFVARLASRSGDYAGALHQARTCVRELRAARVLIPDGFPGSRLL